MAKRSSRIVLEQGTWTIVGETADGQTCSYSFRGDAGMGYGEAIAIAHKSGAMPAGWRFRGYKMTRN